MRWNRSGWDRKLSGTSMLAQLAGASTSLMRCIASAQVITAAVTAGSGTYAQCFAGLDQAGGCASGRACLSVGCEGAGGFLRPKPWGLLLMVYSGWMKG